ncbi:MAG TPA: SDR family oxidoreductase, partial [Acidimicrobiales bacterium]|nr:SDR family oxidoreductase [Acidimicrobiales bacterium]
MTGAASGIGRAAALQFASEGATVAVADIDDAGARATATVIEERGGRARAIPVDVADPKSVESMTQCVAETFGALHYAFNNAGIVGAGAAIADMPVDVWDRGIAVMLGGVFLCMKFEIPLLLGSGGGAIVNTSSGAGIIGFPGMANYVAAKHGVIGLTKAAALEYIGSGIRINAVCPGTARSRMVEDWMQGDPAAEAEVAGLHPIGRIADPEEIAAAALWLCSDEASF